MNLQLSHITNKIVLEVYPRLVIALKTTSCYGRTEKCEKLATADVTFSPPDGVGAV
jgi:hypothetical protein